MDNNFCSCDLSPGVCLTAILLLLVNEQVGKGVLLEPQASAGASAALFRALMTTACLPVSHTHFWLWETTHLE